MRGARGGGMNDASDSFRVLRVLRVSGTDSDITQMSKLYRNLSTSLSFSHLMFLFVN